MVKFPHMVISNDGAPTCNLFGSFGLLVQFILGLLSFSALILKKFMDKNQRTWTVWLMDTSKQGASAAMTHCFNLLAAWAIEKTHTLSNACTWYFLNMCVDVFFGMAICYLFLLGIEKLCQDSK